MVLLTELRHVGLSSAEIAVVLVLIVLAAIAAGVRLVWDIARGLLEMLRGLPLFRPDRRAQRERAARRRLFADHVEGRIRALATKEQWSDHRYAELEAEVEMESEGESATAIFRLVARRSALRRERSLTRALIKTRERVVLLQGEPGAGKSIALRHVARVMARKAMSSRRVNTVIPLYINLKSLRANRRPIDAQLIESHVLASLREKSTADLDRFLDEEFSLGVRDGTWVFLFDSFDEIPDILAATDVDDIIMAYSGAIHDFLTAMRQCRGVVASRQFRAPRRVGWPIWTVVPLTAKRKRELVRRAELGPDATSTILTQLPVAEATMAGLPSNPMFLGLLCEYVRDKGHMPVTSHAVFEEYIAHRFLRDVDRVHNRYGLGPEQIRITAEHIAFCMVAAAGLGLDPTRGEIKAELAQHDFHDTADVDTVMDALEYLKLARGEEGDSRDDSRSFTFAHRRFQEYFATCVVIAAAHLLSPEELLVDGRWRETAVTLCQMQDASVGGIVTEAERRMTQAAGAVAPVTAGDLKEALQGGRPGAQREDFEWPAGSLHILGILQAGFGSRDDLLPTRLRLAASRVLVAAFAFGQIYDRKWALDVGGTADRAVFTSLVRGCFRSGSDWLRDAAYRQVARLGEIPEDISREMRRTLLRMEGTGRLRRERAAVIAQIKRLQSSPELLEVARLLRVSSFVDRAIHLLVACIVIVLAFDEDITVLAALGAMVITVCSAGAYNAIALTLGRRGDIAFIYSWGASAKTVHGDNARGGSFFMREVVPFFRVVSPFGLLALLLPSKFMWYSLPVVIGTVYVLSLGPCALLNAEAGRYIKLRTFPISQLALASAIKRRSWWLELVRGVTFTVVYTGGTVGAFVVLAQLQKEYHPSASSKIGLGILAIVIAGGLLVKMSLLLFRVARDGLHDLRWYTEWCKVRPAIAAPGLIMQWLAAQKTAGGVRRVARDLRSERLVEPSKSSVHLIEDLITASESAIAGRAVYEQTMLSYQGQSPEIEDRLWDVSQMQRKILVSLGTSFVDELGRLVEDLSPNS
jgi:NACHT domain